MNIMINMHNISTQHHGAHAASFKYALLSLRVDRISSNLDIDASCDLFRP
jgi:hypothetical protein